ncbi:MAG: hypothetical protein GOMPHAMPRED_005786 [Gomphillus americanus]|uniref:Micro-fibrillar-associated protein 1 C-terminal domain-containing protein n=1 Tax=Gomphillus americanus TaxID=1940652 RepID=A0A8H3G0J5_9LECA|nr:MAG: hypothetical protein GOMPHAMPRED_005786 [Gomphillus americanus]
MAPPPRMTANPKRPSRYRPGKGHDQSSDSEDETEEEQTEQKPKTKSKPKPVATTTVRGAFQEVTLNGIKASRTSAKAQDINEDEFETESEEEDEVQDVRHKRLSGGIALGQDDVSQKSSGEEEESSEGEADSSESTSEEEEEAPPKLLRPTFIPKSQRTSGTTPAQSTQSDSLTAAEVEARRKEKADALVQAQLERNAQLKANEKKAWDDSDNEGAEGKTEAEVDDTDDIDPEVERAAWKLRELKRIKRSREQIEQAEREREETERRRNLSKEEREAEDAAHLALQEEEREGKGKAGYMQRYFHKGAFFQDSAYAEEAGLKRRDIMGSRFADQVSNREVLPEFMQVRDMAKLGRKGRTKYKDLKAEDTGRWGDYGRHDSNRPQHGDANKANSRIADDTLDERFRPDDFGRGRTGPSGANTIAVNANKRRERPSPPTDAPIGPSGRARGVDRRRSLSRSSSPPSRHDRRYSRERYGSRSPVRDEPRKKHRSRSRQRDRRKRSASPGEYRAKHRDNAERQRSSFDKRVKVD